jgi:quercetin dioxygenase-like cupin family protein
VTDPSSHADLGALAAGAAPGSAWQAEAGDLRARLVVLAPDGELSGHVNREVDLVLVGVSGGGVVTIEGNDVTLGPGVAVLVAQGTHRRVGAGSEGLSLLAVHRRTATSPAWRWQPRRRRPWEDPWEEE